MDIQIEEGLKYLNKFVEDNSVDLILTDPPYIISKESGMNSHYDKIKENKEKNIKYVKTEKEWEEYKKTLDKPQEELDANEGKGWSKENYLKYGSILGKKYAVQTNFGNWDNEFTMEILDMLIL